MNFYSNVFAVVGESSGKLTVKDVLGKITDLYPSAKKSKPKSKKRVLLQPDSTFEVKTKHCKTEITQTKAVTDESKCKESKTNIHLNVDVRAEANASLSDIPEIETPTTSPITTFSKTLMLETPEQKPIPDDIFAIGDDGTHESHDLHTTNANNAMNEPIPMECNVIQSEMIGKALDTTSLTPAIAVDFPQELSAEEENFMSHLDSNSEVISKGYCSDNEVLSRKKEQLKIKIQKCEGRSRSESKKSDKMLTATKAATAEPKKSTSKSRKTSRDRSTSSSKSKDRSEKPAAKKPKLSEAPTDAAADAVTPHNFTVASTKKKTDAKTKKDKSNTPDDDDRKTVLENVDQLTTALCTGIHTRKQSSTAHEIQSTPLAVPPIDLSHTHFIVAAAPDYVYECEVEYTEEIKERCIENESFNGMKYDGYSSKLAENVKCSPTYESVQLCPDVDKFASNFQG